MTRTSTVHRGPPPARRCTGAGGPGPGGRLGGLLVDRRDSDDDLLGWLRLRGLPSIPSAAFSDTTGLTADSVTVGNVSTLYAGLFKGALVGTQAYAAYVNSTGGLNGRKLLVDSYDDGYQGAPNKQEPEQVAQKDFAAVGGFSLQDSYGETVLAANPSVPDVTVSLDQTASDLPNSFSPGPAAVGWPTGGLLYFKSSTPRRHPRGVAGGRPAVRHRQVGWREGRHGVGRLPRGLRPAVRHHHDGLHPVRAGHEAGRGEDPLPRPDAANYAGGGGQGPRPAGLPSGGGLRRLDLLGAADPRTRAGRRPPTGTICTRGPRCTSARTPFAPGGQHLPHLGPEGVPGFQARPLHAVRLAVRPAVLPGVHGGGQGPDPGERAPAAAARSRRSTATT